MTGKQLGGMMESLGFADGERQGLISEQNGKYISTQTGAVVGTKWTDPAAMVVTPKMTGDFINGVTSPPVRSNRISEFAGNVGSFGLDVGVNLWNGLSPINTQSVRSIYQGDLV